MLSLSLLFPLSMLLADLLGLFSLFLAPEVERAYVLGPAAAAALGAALRLRLRDSLLLPFIAGLVFTGLYAAYATSISPTAILSRCVVAAHALLWLTAERGRYQYWRLGVAFMEIVLASILAPESRMFVLIFAFVLAAALALALGFLERNFRARDPAAIGRPLRAGFLGAVLGTAVLVFLGGLAIFPVLPRANWAGLGSSRAEIGYVETVSFRDATFLWGGGERRTLLRLWLPDGMNEREAVPNGLLRGKALEAFDGVEWRATVKRLAALPAVSGGGKFVEVVREPMPTEVLPVPYGLLAVESEGRAVHRYQSGEWLLGARRGQRHSYRYAIVSGRSDPGDLPREVHLRVPRGFPKLAALARKLALESQGETGRIRAVRRQFDGFRAETEAVVAAVDGIAPIENFLFESKRGHCELFASASALLFRSMGMPARLVAGFRVSRAVNNRLLSVRNTDAHAWVEVWTRSRGWVAFDPTPFVLESGGLWEEWMEAYDAIGAFWQRYILGYELETADLRALALKARGLLPFLALAVFCLALLAVLRAAYPHWRESRKPRERARRIRARLRTAPTPEFEREYLRLRFGREEPGAAALRALADHAARLKDSRSGADTGIGGTS